MAAFGGRGCRRPAAGAKGGKGTVWFPCPLLTPPNPPLRRDALRLRGETGVTGARFRASFRFWDAWPPGGQLALSVALSVRGQTVQGACLALRKAPLPSSVYPWSTKRPCGPLAFRRATEGSRVLRKGWGVKRGRETLVSLPLLSLPGDPGIPGRRRRPLCTLTLSVKSPPAASRCIGGTAYPLLRVKKEGRSSPPTAKIKPFSPASAPQRISRSVCRSDTQHPSAQWFRRASVRRSMQ